MIQLCWKCSNFSSCPWSYGIPIEGWVAEKTEISYLIKKCPLFVADKPKNPKYKRVYVKDIGKILNKDIRTIFRYLATKQTKLNKMLRDKGYELRIELDDKLNNYYIRKLEEDNNE